MNSLSDDDKWNMRMYGFTFYLNPIDRKQQCFSGLDDNVIIKEHFSQNESQWGLYFKIKPFNENSEYQQIEVNSSPIELAIKARKIIFNIDFLSQDLKEKLGFSYYLIEPLLNHNSIVIEKHLKDK